MQPRTEYHRMYNIPLRWDYNGGSYIFLDDQGRIKGWAHHAYLNRTWIYDVRIFKKGDQWCVGSPSDNKIIFCATYKNGNIVITRVGATYGIHNPYYRKYYIIDRGGNLREFFFGKIPCKRICYKEYDVNFSIPVTQLAAYAYFFGGGVSSEATNSRSVCRGARSCIVNTVA